MSPTKRPVAMLKYVAGKSPEVPILDTQVQFSNPPHALRGDGDRLKGGAGVAKLNKSNAISCFLAFPRRRVRWPDGGDSEMQSSQSGHTDTVFQDENALGS